MKPAAFGYEIVPVMRNVVESLGFAETPENIYWSYDGEEFSLRRDSAQIYLERPAYRAPQKLGSLREESFAAARLISEKHPRPVLLYSGGIDSEAVLLSFHLQKLPLEVVIIDYQGLNEHDIHRARKFCEKIGVAYKTITRDIHKFWENDLESLAQRIHCPSPQIAALCWVTTELDGYVIVGDGDSSLMRSHREFFEIKSEKWALARWMLLNRKEGCPRYFQYTSALEASTYFDPLVEGFVNGAWEFFEFRKFMYLKPFLFYHHFGCGLRPKITGFENISACDEYRRGLSNLISPVQHIVWTYENARRWACQAQPPQKWLPLKDSAVAKEEMAGLSQDGIRDYLIWTD